MIATHQGKAMATSQDKDESDRLEQAIRKADEMLLSSLRSDETARRSRRWKILGAALALILIAGATLILWSSLRPPAPSAEVLERGGWKLWNEGKLASAESMFAKAVEV